PDRVLPMLPEELSNGICSLRPAEDRLVKAVRLELERRGRETAVSSHDAVMRSAARLTYTQVRQALVDRDPAVRAALGPLVEPLERAEALARLLMARRRQRGAIDFDLPEAEVVLDLRGRPEQIVRAERPIAHQMIEEFMLAANEAVARELGRRNLGFPHRLDEPPTSAWPPTATPPSPRPSAATRTWSCTAFSAPGAYRPTSAPSRRSPHGKSAWRWRPSARSWS